jgi:DNA-binding transcriptional ArsR family regulator
MRNNLVTHWGMDQVAQALADPVRRQILLLLRGREVTAGALAGSFPVSRPAVSRHLRVLREAGLVRDEPNGRERAYHLELAALAELEAYLEQLHAACAWEQRFAALATEVQRVKKRRRQRSSHPARHPRKETA